jgi:MoxR-like ATPase
MSRRISEILELIKIVQSNFNQDTTILEMTAYRKKVDKIISENNKIKIETVRDKYRRQLEPEITGTNEFDEKLFSWLSTGSNDLKEILINHAVNRQDEEGINKLFNGEDVNMPTNKIRESLIEFLTIWNDEKQNKFGGQYRSFEICTHLLPDLFNSISPDLLHKGSVGVGEWATIPWIASMNKTITTTVSKGVYVVYLFPNEGEGVYLTLNQGTGGFSPQTGSHHDLMIENILESLSDKKLEFELGALPQNSLSENPNAKSRAYENACIMWKYYSLSDLESMDSDLQLVKDYESIIDIYMNSEDVILSTISLQELETHDEISHNSDKRYWLIAPGERARLWNDMYEEGIIGIGWDDLGDLKQYNSNEDIANKLQEIFDEEGLRTNDSLACFQFANEISDGDIIITKKGRTSYLGYGVVTSDYIYDNTRNEYHHIRSVNWLKKGEWVEQESNIVIKTLTEITQYTDYVQRLEKLIGIGQEEDLQPFTIEDATRDLFLHEDNFKEYLKLLQNKKNVILQGPPGVGKTFIAKRLANALIGFRDSNRVDMVQFHQSYSYEDFIQGFRPNPDTGEGFQLQSGLFYDLCQRAQFNPNDNYVLVIDEINRGNLSKIFGELMMLIERDKRGSEYALSLTYSAGEEFYVPENLFIIGTMNTADRSIAMVDYALRRRFIFIVLNPEFNSERFKSFLRDKGVAIDLINTIIENMNSLNEEIAGDINNLGDGYQIGHSYFCPNNENDNKWYNEVIKYEIVPLLKEYWFDEPKRVDDLISSLRI